MNDRLEAKSATLFGRGSPGLTATETGLTSPEAEKSPHGLNRKARRAAASDRRKLDKLVRRMRIATTIG